MRHKQHTSEEAGYPLLKEYAFFILTHHLTRATIENLALARASKLPLLSLFAHLNEEELLAVGRQNLEEFLQQVVAGTALRSGLATIDQWKAGLLPDIPRDKVAGADIVLTHSIRKQLFLKLLPLYTTDYEKIIGIALELERFHTQLEEYASRIHLDIAQEGMQRQRDFYESLINSSTDGIVGFDRQLRITAWNRALESRYSLPKEAILGRTLGDLIPAYLTTEKMAALQKVLQGESIWFQDELSELGRGDYNLEVVPQRLNGEIIGGIIIVHDLTVQKEAEREIGRKNSALATALEELQRTQQQVLRINTELEERVRQRTLELEQANYDKAELLDRERAAHAEAETQRQRLHTVFMQAPALLSIVRGPEFVYELANPKYLQTLGTSEPIEGKALAQVIPDLEPAVMAILQRVYTQGERFIGNELPIAADWDHNGKIYTRYFNLIYEPLREADGHVGGLITFGYEVTDLIDARREAAENADKLRTFIESIPQIAWISRLDGSTSYLNPQWYQFTGADFAEEGWDWLAYLHPEDIPLINQLWEQSLRNGHIFECKYRIRRASDGTYRWMLGRTVPVRDDAGNITSWVGTATDIHDQQLAEEALEQKNKELIRINNDLDNFVYTASHDLKSPVTTLEGFTSVLAKKLQGRLNEQEVQILKYIQLSSARLKSTIRDLTEVVKIQKGIETDISELSFEAVFAEVQEDMQRDVYRSDADIHTDFGVGSITYSHKYLRSVLYNLLSNALKYRSPLRKPLIHIRTQAVEGGIELSVRDNGLGIPAEYLPKMFTMFKRFHNHVEGSGVGLYIIKRIVENNNGSIRVESVEGEGSTFIVVLHPAA